MLQTEGIKIELKPIKDLIQLKKESFLYLLGFFVSFSEVSTLQLFAIAVQGVP